MIPSAANSKHVSETDERENTNKEQSSKSMIMMGMSSFLNLSSALLDDQQAGQDALAKSTAALNVVLDGKKLDGEKDDDDDEEMITTKTTKKVAEVVEVSRRRRSNRRWNASMSGLGAGHNHQNQEQQDGSSAGTGISPVFSKNSLPRKCKSLGDKVLMRKSSSNEFGDDQQQQHEEEGQSEMRKAINRCRSFEARAAAFATTTSGKNWNWKKEEKVTTTTTTTLHARKTNNKPNSSGINRVPSSPNQLIHFERCKSMGDGSAKRASASEALEKHKRELLERSSKKAFMRRARSHDTTLVPLLPARLSSSALDDEEQNASTKTSADVSSALDKSSRRMKLSSLALAMAKSHSDQQVTSTAVCPWPKSQSEHLCRNDGTMIPALTASFNPSSSDAPKTRSSSLDEEQNTSRRASDPSSALDNKISRRMKFSSLALAMAKSHSEQQGTSGAVRKDKDLSHDGNMVPDLTSSFSSSSSDETKHISRRASDPSAGVLDKSSRRMKLSSLALAMAKSHSEQGNSSSIGIKKESMDARGNSANNSITLMNAAKIRAVQDSIISIEDIRRASTKNKTTSNKQSQSSDSDDDKRVEDGTLDQGSSKRRSTSMSSTPTTRSNGGKPRRSASKGGNNKSNQSSRSKSSDFDNKRDEDGGLDQGFSNKGSVSKSSSPTNSSNGGMPRRTTSKGNSKKSNQSSQSSPTNAERVTSTKRRSRRRASTGMNESMDFSSNVTRHVPRRSSTFDDRRVKVGGRRRSSKADSGLSVSASDHLVLQQSRTRGTADIYHSECIYSARRSQQVCVAQPVSPKDALADWATMSKSDTRINSRRRLPSDSSSSSGLNYDGNLDLSSSLNYVATTPYNHDSDNEQEESTATGAKRESNRRRRRSSLTIGGGVDQLSSSCQALTAAVKQSSAHHHRRRRSSARRKRFSGSRGGGGYGSLNSSVSSLSVNSRRSASSSSISGSQLQQAIKQPHQENQQLTMPNDLDREGRRGNEERGESTRESSAVVRQPEVNKLEELEQRSKHSISHGLNDSTKSGLTFGTDASYSLSSISSHSDSVGGTGGGVVVLPMVSRRQGRRTSLPGGVSSSSTVTAVLAQEAKPSSSRRRSSMPMNNVVDDPLQLGSVRSTLRGCDLDSDSEDELLITSQSCAPITDMGSAVGAYVA